MPHTHKLKSKRTRLLDEHAHAIDPNPTYAKKIGLQIAAVDFALLGHKQINTLKIRKTRINELIARERKLKEKRRIRTKTTREQKLELMLKQTTAEITGTKTILKDHKKKHDI